MTTHNDSGSSENILEYLIWIVNVSRDTNLSYHVARQKNTMLIFKVDRHIYLKKFSECSLCSFIWYLIIKNSKLKTKCAYILSYHVYMTYNWMCVFVLHFVMVERNMEIVWQPMSLLCFAYSKKSKVPIVFYSFNTLEVWSESLFQDSKQSSHFNPI